MVQHDIHHIMDVPAGSGQGLDYLLGGHTAFTCAIDIRNKRMRGHKYLYMLMHLLLKINSLKNRLAAGFSVRNRL